MRLRTCEVVNPLGEKITASYVELGNNTAVIEMARASGLERIPPAKYDPFQATTFGTGQLIRQALARGRRRFIVGIGGSATVDGGAGAAQALGVRFYDSRDREIKEYMNGRLIGECRSISMQKRRPEISECEFMVASDVRTPLLGPKGAVYTYAIQKGASQAQLPILENSMHSFYELVENQLSGSLRDLPGAGAAGGLGAGLVAFLGAQLMSGIDLVLDTLGFDKLLSQVDVVITGEGSLDNQTGEGKVVQGVIQRARRMSTPVLIIVGKLTENAVFSLEADTKFIYPLVSEGVSGSFAIENARELLIKTGARAIKNFLKERCGYEY